MSNKVCPTCNSPLTRIDHYGEILVGCVDCTGDKKHILEMPEDDLEALRAHVRRRHPPH